MPGPLGRVLILAGVWTLAAIILWWVRLPGSWRRGLALLASAAGLVFLVLALNTAGQREEPTTTAFLLGPSTITGKASASASLPFYVLTGACLLLGTAGLAVSDRVARGISRHWMATAIALSLLVTLLRFLLEQAAAPAAWAWAAGITALAPVVGAFFAVNLRAEGKGVRHLARALLLYGLAVRGTVAAVMAVTTTLMLGSHYDVSSWVRVVSPVTGRVYDFAPGSAGQVLYLGVFPQLLFWPGYTLVAGLLGAALTVILASAWGGGLPAARPRVEMAPARQDP